MEIGMKKWTNQVNSVIDILLLLWHTSNTTGVIIIC